MRDEWNYRMWGIATSPTAPNSFLLALHGGLNYSPDCEIPPEPQEGKNPRSSNIFQVHSNIIASDTVQIGDGEKATFSSTGIDNVTTYGIRVDPFDESHVALLNTDFGVTLSNDGGRTWREWPVADIPNNWRENIYDLEFDRYIEGRAYSIWSSRSDVPYETRPNSDPSAKGGLAVLSADENAWKTLNVTWKPQTGEGALPANAIPVAMDVVYPQDASAENPGGARTIWVAAFGKGLFRSVDSGVTFQEVNTGISTTDELVYALDVEASEDGSQVFAITARRTDGVVNSSSRDKNGRLWQLGADGESWTEISLPEGVTCPRDISWDEQRETLYISCCADNKWKSDGGDKSQPDFYNLGGGLYAWHPGDASAVAVDAESDVVGPTCSIEGSVADSAGNLFASDVRGNVYVRPSGQAEFARIYEKFHVASKGIQLVEESVSSDGTRADTLSLPSFGGGLLKLSVSFTAPPTGSGEDEPSSDDSPKSDGPRDETPAPRSDDDASNGTQEPEPAGAQEPEPANALEQGSQQEQEAAPQLAPDGTAFGQGASLEAAESALSALLKDSDPAGTRFGTLKLRQANAKKTSIKLSWSKARAAKAYVLYGAKSGKSHKMKRIARISSTQMTVKKVGGKKLRKGTSYKFMVIAVDGAGNVVSSSKLAYVGTTGGKAANPLRVKASAKSGKVNLKAGKRFKLKAKVEVLTQGANGSSSAQIKKSAKAHRKLSYESSNPSVATVSKSGVVKARGKGSCIVYAYAQNGVFAKTRIRVG